MVVNRVVSKVAIVIIYITGRITPPIPTHEPPSTIVERAFRNHNKDVVRMDPLGKPLF